MGGVTRHIPDRFRAVVGSPWLRVAGTVAAVAVLARSVDIPKAAASLGHADPRWMAAALGLTCVAVVASVLEWGVLIRTVSAPAQASLFTWRRLSSSYLQSLFFTQVIPAGVGGDAVRTVEMGKHVGHSRVLASLAGSRMAGMLGMAAWGLAGAVLLRALIGNGILAALAVLVGVIIMVWTGALSADRLVPVRLLTRLSAAMGHAVRAFTESFAAYRRHPHAVAQCLLVGGAGWGVNLFALVLAARAIGADVSWPVLAVCIPLGLLAALVPFSVNGLGVREGVLVAFLVHMGVSSTHAGALSLIVDLQMLPFAVLGCVLWMRRRRAPAPAPASITVPARA